MNNMNEQEKEMSKVETVNRETREYFNGEDHATKVFITKLLKKIAKVECKNFIK